MAAMILCRFAEWENSTLYRLRDGGDEADPEKTITMLNESNAGEPYIHAAKYLMDFSIVSHDDLKKTKHREFCDYPWWLAQRQNGAWKIIRSGQ